MPFVSRGHIECIMAVSSNIVASTDGHRPLPPALFDRDIWPELLATNGDAGARSFLQGATLVTAPAFELRDIDVPADLLDTQRR
jgi:molybdenum cofactor cytidylyltransferase